MRVPLLWTVVASSLAAAPPPPPTSGGITVLYAFDPIASSLSFADGGYGRVVQAHEARNRSSDLDFGQYKTDHFTTATDGGHRGAIVDLGTGEEMQKRYGYAETVGGGQGFASLRIVEGRVVIRKDAAGVQPVTEARALFEQTDKSATAPIVPGHVYLVRVADRDDKTDERIAKLIVLAYSPGQAVTLRWERLR